MLYNDHWDEVKTMMTRYWERDDMERCCAAIRVKDSDYTDFGEHNFYFDTKTADEMHRERFSHHQYFGEALPCLFPYFGTAGIAEYTGCKAVRTPRTTWFEPWLEDTDASLIEYKCPEVFEAQKNAINELIKLSNGDYLVSVSDNCGVLDALAAIRGTDELLMDMIAEPEFVEEGLRRLLPIYKRTQSELFNLVKDNNEGAVLSWMHLWAPKSMAQMQCDMSVMISKEMFDRFAMPELEEMCEFLDYPVYHLDGQEQVRHLDSLLSLKKLRAIQWTPVAGQPPTVDFIPVLQKIQRAGKNLILFAPPKDALKLAKELDNRGLNIVIDGAGSREEAEDILRRLEKCSHRT